MASIEKIVVAVDFSEHSRSAVDMAVEIADKFGASIHLIHVFEMPIPISSESTGGSRKRHQSYAGLTI